MVLFRSWPAVCLFAASVLPALLSCRGKRSGATSFISVLCSVLLILLILMEGGALPEGLACLLPVLYLILPKETRHEL